MPLSLRLTHAIKLLFHSLTVVVPKRFGTVDRKGAEDNGFSTERWILGLVTQKLRN